MPANRRPAGWEHTADARLRISDKLSVYARSEQGREARRRAALARWAKPDARVKQSRVMRAYWHERHAEQLAAQLGAHRYGR